jgi:hypothetical protein
MNVFKQFIKSLYSTQDMATFRFQKIGKTIGYVFILMLIASIPLAIQITSFINTSIAGLNEVVQSEIPDFELKNGKLTSQIEEPITREADGMYFIFDTTDSVTRDDINEYDDAVAFYSDHLIIKSMTSVDEVRYESFGAVTLTKEDVSMFADQLSEIAPIAIPIMIIIAYLFFTALKFIGVTVLALIGLIVRNIAKRNLSYRQLWMLSAYAVTIPTIFFAIIDLLEIIVPFSLALYWFVAILVLYLVVKKVPASKSVQTEQE